MKTDISKLSFDESKHYLSVYEQMGRVRLDSDANEDAEIGLRREQRQAADTVRTGSPNNGFRVDTYLLLDALDERESWLAEKANPADPEPRLFVDYFDHRVGQGSLKATGAAALVHAPAEPVDLRELREVVFAAKGLFAVGEIFFFLGQGGAAARPRGHRGHRPCRRLAHLSRASRSDGVARGI